jgi:DNA-binding winged helix-turn-helix (wHTH) protein
MLTHGPKGALEKFMASGCYQFDRFRLDVPNRQLWRDEDPVNLNARYFDALTLLVSEQGRLVIKERFLAEVWQGVPVTDEALTQCIRTLRRLLEDRAGQPRFIETVPKHGYRFIASVDIRPLADTEAAWTAAPPPDKVPDWSTFFALGAAGTAGAGLAGVIGGSLLGLAGATQPLQPVLGSMSVFLVVLCLTLLMAVIGGAALSFGIAATTLIPGRERSWAMLGGATGGLVVGGTVKLLGLDAFELLLAHSPGDITGAAEGIVLGAAVGCGAWLGWREPARFGSGRHLALTSLAGLGAGLIITLLGGRLMAGSLDVLIRNLPQARLRLDVIGTLVGEGNFGPVSQVIVGGLEGAIFATCIVAGMALAQRRLGRTSTS